MPIVWYVCRIDIGEDNDLSFFGAAALMNWSLICLVDLILFLVFQFNASKIGKFFFFIFFYFQVDDTYRRCCVTCNFSKISKAFHIFIGYGALVPMGSESCVLLEKKIIHAIIATI